jgi:hypothetical protein
MESNFYLIRFIFNELNLIRSPGRQPEKGYFFREVSSLSTGS